MKLYCSEVFVLDDGGCLMMSRTTCKDILVEYILISLRHLGEEIMAVESCRIPSSPKQMELGVEDATEWGNESSAR